MRRVGSGVESSTRYRRRRKRDERARDSSRREELSSKVSSAGRQGQKVWDLKGVGREEGSFVVCKWAVESFRG